MGLTNILIGAWNVVGGLAGYASQRNGKTWFVDNNDGSDSNDGESWETPYKTLAKAISVNNANIASGKATWAKRNTIFYCADTETATLVAFPNKCDVVGCGSYDGNSMAGITGNHAPVNAANYGTRFFNVWFKAATVAAPTVTLASTSSGIQFIGCTFSGNATSTIGIQATASPFLKVIGCRFEGAYATSDITFGTGEAGGTEIIGCRFTDSAASGIVIGAATTTSWGAFIDNCIIKAATVCINDAASLFHITNCNIISLASVTGYTTPTEALVSNAALCSNCFITAANVNFAWPIADTTT